MNDHHHARASMTSLVVCLAIITLMIGLALSSAHKFTAQIHTSSPDNTVKSAAALHDCTGVATQSIGANAAGESEAQLQAEATQAQHCADTAQSNLSQ